MNTIYSTELSTAYGAKRLSVVAQDVTTLTEHIDLLTTSAYEHSYTPTVRSLFGALYYSLGISAYRLAEHPYIDLRRPAGVWLSSPIEKEGCPIGRIGCIEFRYKDGKVDEERLLGSMQAYFYMLDVATASGMRLETLALPLLGTGSQRVSANLILAPLLNECISFLKRNAAVKEVLFIERDTEKAEAFVTGVRGSLSLLRAAKAEETATATAEEEKPLAFISYTTRNRNVADNLCFKLESRGIRVWYAPRNVEGPYATAIAEAIERATYFIVILSRDSMVSEHMLNEIDLAFQRLPRGIKFKPLRIDTAELAPAFNYYLSRQHWMDAHIPPLEERLDEFVDSL